MSSGDIGLFKLATEAGVAAGVRRIEAYTGQRRVGSRFGGVNRFSRKSVANWVPATRLPWTVSQRLLARERRNSKRSSVHSSKNCLAGDGSARRGRSR